VLNALFPPHSAEPETVLSVLPKLRLAARILLTDPAAADRLVEHTFEQAIERVNLKRLDDDLSTWVGGMIDETHRRTGQDFLQ
jgi:DNA-directed RNA polymerase specialized sigma24 family protein